MTKLFSTATTQDGNRLLASYNISLLIAKSGISHTIGKEQIIPAISELIRTVVNVPSKVRWTMFKVKKSCAMLHNIHFKCSILQNLLRGNSKLLRGVCQTSARQRSLKGTLTVVHKQASDIITKKFF